MIRTGEYLVKALAWMLEPDERDAVLGDFRDSSESTARAGAGLLGLIIRRQLMLWTRWQPWVALVGLACLSGVILSEAVGGLETVLESSFNGLNGYLRYADRADSFPAVAQHIVFLISFALSVAAWSWIIAFALGSLSGRASWFTGLAFNLVVVNSFLARLAHSGNLQLRGNGSLAIMFITRVFRVVPTTVGESLFFLVPALCGIYAGIRRRHLPLRVAVMLLAAMAFLTSAVSLASESYGLGTTRIWHAPGLSLQIALMGWPLLYIIVTANKPLRSATTD